jgi:hypothetical protein
VLDPDLLGYWSDDAIYLGAMEAADIAFRADGSASPASGHRPTPTTTRRSVDGQAIHS